MTLLRIILCILVAVTVIGLCAWKRHVHIAIAAAAIFVAAAALSLAVAS